MSSEPAARHARGSLLVDAAVIFGLAGVAVGQPLLELFGDNPTFFVAGRYRPAHIVVFGALVAVVPALVVFIVSVLPRLAGQRAGAVAHGVGVGLLAGAFGLVACRTAGIDGLVVTLAVASILGVGVALAERRWRPARMFLTYLALGNLAFLGLFLLASPTADLLRAAPVDPPSPGDVPALDGPVVVVVLDEFPLTALVRSDGTINEERYPNFAHLAARSTWFRNAASESADTYVSLPTILTGVAVADDRAPTYRDHPRNYFTLFGDRYPVNAYSTFSALCPPELCEPYRPGTVRQMLADAAIVYGHRALPERFRRELPSVDRAWGRFGQDLGVQAWTTAGADLNPLGALDQVPPGDLGVIGQVGAFRRQVAKLGPEPSVNLLHVTLPHHPYVLTPWGATLPDTWQLHMLPERPTEPGYHAIHRDLYALQALQVGGVDRMVGEMIDHLRAVGAWDDTLVVVTSDHGLDITPPGVGREPTDDNQDELYRIPLFVKVPGQVEGEIRDDPASTVDVLPSIVDVLGIETDWEFDGRSLYGDARPAFDRRVTSGIEALAAAAARHADRYPGDGWEALAAVGDAADLVGRKITDPDTDPPVTVGQPSDLRWWLDHGDLLDDLSTTSGPVPYLLRGHVAGSDGKPPELVVALNGTVAGTVGGYRQEGEVWRFSGFMAPYFRDGRNEVVAYEVDRSGDEVVLHALGED